MVSKCELPARLRLLATWLLVAACALLLCYDIAPRASARESILDEIADLPAEEARTRFGDLARSLIGSPDVERANGLTYACDQAAGFRKRRYAELIALRDASLAALRAAGYEREGLPPELTVVEVRAATSDDEVIIDEVRGLVLARRGRGGSASSLPTTPSRDDGPPTVKDVVRAVGQLRLALDGRARGSDPAGGSALEQYLVLNWARWSGVPRDLPPWLRSGIPGWLVTASRKGDTAPTHTCGGGADPRARLIASLSDTAIVTPGDSAVFARVVAALAAAKGRLPDGIRKLQTAGKHDAAGFEAAFGPAAELAIGAAMQDLVAATTCEDGTLPCPICDGAGKLVMTCPDCAGTGRIACPSCEGNSLCPAKWCIGGLQYFGRRLKEKCVFCKGKGELNCKACLGKGAARCRACTGDGKLTRPCPGCIEGRIPCPESGFTAVLGRLSSDADDCPWCAEEGLQAGCPDCNGAGFQGCSACKGFLKVRCTKCGGSGGIPRFTPSGYVLFEECPDCGRAGGFPCKLCRQGKLKCETCGGKGVRPRLDADCALCGGTRHRLALAAVRERLRSPSAPASAAEAALNKAMLDRAVAFLLTCTDPTTGAFALRDFRDSPTGPAGKLDEATPFSNALCIWALSTVGIDGSDERMKRPYRMLQYQADQLGGGQDKYRLPQKTSLLLRALIGAGESSNSKRVAVLVEMLERGQRKDGLWSDDLDTPEEGDGSPFDTLFVIEALRAAKSAGAKVDKNVWSKAFRGSKKALSSWGIAKMQKDFLTTTDVTSSTALVILTKAGTLGSEAGTFDYESLPEVRRGLAWLDRHFDISSPPRFSSGALVPRHETAGAGFAADLFAIQRLAMLLNIDLLAHERWHTTGARYLRSQQLSDGSFEELGPQALNGPVRTTCTAILFLVRATTPITEKQ